MCVAARSSWPSSPVGQPGESPSAEALPGREAVRGAQGAGPQRSSQGKPASEACGMRTWEPVKGRRDLPESGGTTRDRDVSHFEDGLASPLPEAVRGNPDSQQKPMCLSKEGGQAPQEISRQFPLEQPLGRTHQGEHAVRWQSDVNSFCCSRCSLISPKAATQ